MGGVTNHTASLDADLYQTYNTTVHPHTLFDGFIHPRTNVHPEANYVDLVWESKFREYPTDNIEVFLQLRLDFSTKPWGEKFPPLKPEQLSQFEFTITAVQAVQVVGQALVTRYSRPPNFSYLVLQRIVLLAAQAVPKYQVVVRFDWGYEGIFGTLGGWLIRGTMGVTATLGFIRLSGSPPEDGEWEVV